MMFLAAQVFAALRDRRPALHLRQELQQQRPHSHPRGHRSRSANAGQRTADAAARFASPFTVSRQGARKRGAEDLRTVNRRAVCSSAMLLAT
jgi:hypothetical protein